MNATTGGGWSSANRPKNLHAGGRWAPLTRAQAGDPSNVVDRLLEALFILEVHIVEWERLHLMGLCPHSSGIDFEQAAIVVNRIGYLTGLLSKATEPTGLQHERVDGLYGPPFLQAPPSKTVKAALERLNVAITLLVDVATNPVALKALRTECSAAVRMEATITLQQLQSLCGPPIEVIRGAG